MSRPLLTTSVATCLAVGVALALSACAPEPENASSVTVAPSTSATASPTPSTKPSDMPTPTATTTTAALPSSCAEFYPADLTATLTTDIPPLDDPALSDFLSTESIEGLEILGSGVPVLRCTWGAAGTPGLATTVAAVDTSAADAIRQQLEESGFVCDDLEGGTVCSQSQQTIDKDDRVRQNGETHWFGLGFWLATHWVDYDPDGYTKALAVRLAG